MESRVEDALGFINTLELVGVTSMDVVLVSCVLVNGDRQVLDSISDASVGCMREMVPELIRRCDSELNIIIRPHGPDGTTLIQLDDLTKKLVTHAARFAFAVLCTSYDNFQAWLSVPDAQPDTRHRLIDWLKADKGANGAVRLPGSRNVKETHHRQFGHYPVVRTVRLANRNTSVTVLEDAGLPPRTVSQSPPCTSQIGSGPKAWPDYARCLDGASPARTHPGKDRSSADFVWSRTALQWGWSEADTIHQLQAVSEKAFQRGPKYAVTVVSGASKSLK